MARIPAPPPAALRGGVTLRRRPERTPPAPAGRPFRILIEGILADGGQIGLGRVIVESDPAYPVTPLEAETICRRVAFAPPAVPIAALQSTPEPEEKPS